ncbi:VanZ family protein [Streptomyces cadmiisoli]|uniref:VanZ family protein n=1 Tax=Streptomyces cadmiisoli TaxID=2184053 RepID=UPI00365389C8
MGDINYRLEALPVCTPLVVLFFGFLIVRAIRNGSGPQWGWRSIPIRTVTATYIAGVAGFTFFPFQIAYGKLADDMAWYNQINWIPVLTLDVPTAVLNVIMTVPLGVLLPFVSGKITSPRRALAYGAAFSLAIEVAQILGCVLFNNYRGADVNDVFTNALGCLLGYSLLQLTLKLSFPRDVFTRLALPDSVLAREPHSPTRVNTIAV